MAGAHEDPGDFAKQSLELLSPLGPVLHRAMEPSLEEARAYFVDRQFDGYVFADLARYHTCCRLAAMALPPYVEFTRLRNNGIRFECRGATARVWKADEGGELQGPGNSKAKQEYFAQRELFSREPTQVRYAIVWEYDFATGLLIFSLACPREFDANRPWNNPDCHFYIEFPHAATEVSASPGFKSPQEQEGDIELKPKRHAGESGDKERSDTDD